MLAHYPFKMVLHRLNSRFPNSAKMRSLGGGGELQNGSHFYETYYSLLNFGWSFSKQFCQFRVGTDKIGTLITYQSSTMSLSRRESFDSDDERITWIIYHQLKMYRPSAKTNEYRYVCFHRTFTASIFHYSDYKWTSVIYAGVLEEMSRSLSLGKLSINWV